MGGQSSCFVKRFEKHLVLYSSNALQFRVSTAFYGESE